MLCMYSIREYVLVCLVASLASKIRQCLHCNMNDTFDIISEQIDKASHLCRPRLVYSPRNDCQILPQRRFRPNVVGTLGLSPRSYRKLPSRGKTNWSAVLGMESPRVAMVRPGLC